MSWIPPLIERSGFSAQDGRDAFFLFNLSAVFGVLTLGWLASRWLGAPMIFDLRMDPYEKATTSNNYWTLWSERVFQIAQGGRYVQAFAATFKDFPQRQRPASWSIDQMLEKYMSK